MAKFASASKQASTVVHLINAKGEKDIKGHGTSRNYQQALTRVAEFCKDNKINGIQSLTIEQANLHLAIRSEIVGQKTLDLERQAIQKMFSTLTGKLERGQTLPVIKSEIDQVLTGRAYSSEQVEMIANAQRGENRLATQIAEASGLRAHELLTLQRIDERTADKRPNHDEKWKGVEGVKYIVEGKGGLVREIVIPSNLVKELEAVRLNVPRTVIDRDITYKQHYAVSGGQRWSSSFSSASNRSLGRSHGAHGLRHSYAQQRMSELIKAVPRAAALEITSQEMGHFRPEITEVYLR